MTPTYTVDWTTQHIPHWREWLHHLASDGRGPRHTRIAEIGCFEGRSTRWFVEYMHPAVIGCFDNFSGCDETVFRRNVDDLIVSKVLGRTTYDLFNCLPFDFIYIDADHKPMSVLIDAVNAWQALKPGGILVFDDYRLVDSSRGVNVKVAVDAFCTVMGLEMHHSPWPKPEFPDYWGQVMVRKSL